MKRWALVLAAGLLFADSAHSQIFVNPYYGVSGVGLRYTRVRRNSFFSLSLGNYRVRSGFTAFGPGGFYPGPFYPPTVRSITIIQTPPPIIVPRPAVIGDPLADPFDDLARDVLPRAFLDRRPDPRDFAPLEKPDRLRPEPAGPFQPDKPDRLKPKRDPLPPPPQPQRPAADPRIEYSRLMEAGKKSFENGQYGEAAEHFRRAARLLPNVGEPHFHLTQTYIALGKYFDAIDSIRAGLAQNENWPRAHFRPVTLYGKKVDKYADHLKRLETTFENHKNHEELAFVWAYQLWLDGQRQKAVAVFEPLRKGPDRKRIELFLRALPGAGVF